MTTRLAPAALAAVAALALCAAPTTPASAATAPHVRRPPATSAPDFGPRAFVLGDSLTVGTLYCTPPYPCLTRVLATAGISTVPAPDARIGRKVAEGLSRLRAVRTRLGASTVVIALGTNDRWSGSAAAREWVAQARAIVGTDVTLAWVDVRLTGSQLVPLQSAINAGLLRGVHDDDTAQQVAGHHGRTVLLDWRAFAADHGIANGRDGIHLSPQGYQARAAFLAGVLTGDPELTGYVRS